MGGAANVAQAGNCMTPALDLRDESLADEAPPSSIDGVMGDRQRRAVQVVLGPGRRKPPPNDERPAGGGTCRRADAKGRRGGEKQALKGRQTSAVQKFLANSPLSLRR